MTSITPVRLTVDRRVLITLGRVFDAAQPWEGCALLLGQPGSHTHLQQIWPCLNSWPDGPERTRRFSVDPREQLLAQRWARQRGLAVLGSAHSHPQSAAIPSRLDQELTVAPALMLIGGRPQDRPQSHWDWAFWWLEEPAADAVNPAPTPLPWTMDV